MLAFQFMSKEKAHGGTIVNIGSFCSVKPLVSSPIYTATKHAVLGLTKAYGVSDFRCLVVGVHVFHFVGFIKFLEVSFLNNFCVNS